jgi:dienelactone hydrolase
MYFRWLDKWDEQRAQRGEADKLASKYILDTHLAFPGKVSDTIDEFDFRSKSAATDEDFFTLPDSQIYDVQRHGNQIHFQSKIVTDVENNNTAHATITESPSSRGVLLVFHHWNARSRLTRLSRALSRRGFTVVEMSMPYHFERSRPNALYADYMLSSNLGRTIQSIKQAVVDGQVLISWLKAEGHANINVIGFSLGSWVAGLLAAHNKSVSKASLCLTAGSLAGMVWSGRATRTIRSSVEQALDLESLESLWLPVNQIAHAQKLARPNLDLQIVLAKRDKVVLPSLSRDFIKSLYEANASPQVLELSCGHYSLALPPFALQFGFHLDRFLRK